MQTTFMSVTLNSLPIILASILIYVLAVDLLKRKRKEDPNSPSTFFSLDVIVSRNRFRIICLLSAGALVTLFVAIALNAQSLVEAAKQILGGYIESTLGISSVQSFTNAIPPWLDPLFVLIAFLLLFGPWVRSILLFLRDVFMRAAGIYNLVDQKCLLTAEKLLADSGQNFKKASDKLAAALRKESPVPANFADLKNEKLIAYQILWSISPQISKNGFSKSLNHARSSLGLPLDETEKTTNFALYSASTFIFMLLMAIYVVIIPLFGIYIKHIDLYKLTHGHIAIKTINWPDFGNDGFKSLIRYVLEYTLAFAIPLTLAIQMYPTRRIAFRSKETQRQTFSIIAMFQFITSFFVMEIFNVIDVSIAIQTGNHNYSIVTPRIHISAILYSLIPIFAFWLILFYRNNKITPIFGVTLTSIAVGIMFGFSDFIYECYLPKFDNYYIHQSILGFYISISFFAARLPIRRTAS